MLKKWLSLFGLFIYFTIDPATASVPSAFHPENLKGPNLITGTPFAAAKKSTVTVVLFLSSKCPCSQSHASVVETLHKEFPEFQFVGVHSNQDEPVSSAKKYFQSSGLSIPIIHDAGAKIADQFGALKTPHVFVLDEKGMIKYQGGVTNSSNAQKATHIYLRDALSALRDRKEPNPAEVRTLGCYIVR